MQGSIRHPLYRWRAAAGPIRDGERHHHAKPACRKGVAWCWRGLWSSGEDALVCSGSSSTPRRTRGVTVASTGFALRTSSSTETFTWSDEWMYALHPMGSQSLNQFYSNFKLNVRIVLFVLEYKYIHLLLWFINNDYIFTIFRCELIRNKQIYF